MRKWMTRAALALIGTSAGIRLIGTAVVAVLLIGPATALAQQPATRTEEVSASFTIEAIDHSTRVVTLRNKAGLLEEVYCGPEVQRFDALKVGDMVTFRYFETIVTALSRPGARERRRRRRRSPALPAHRAAPSPARPPPPSRSTRSIRRRPR